VAKATAAYSCDRATAALVFSWGEAGGGNVGAARYLNGAGFLIVLLSFSFCLFHVVLICFRYIQPFSYLISLLFGLLIARIRIRPVNSAYFLKMYVSFLL
jgi:hypothetical protein